MRTLGPAVLAALAWLAPLYASAQGFNAEIFRPANSTSAAFSQDTAHVLRDGDLNAGLTLDFAHNSLVLRDPTSNDVLSGGGVVANRLVGHLGVAYGLAGVLELRARLPVIPYESGNVAPLRAGGDLGTVSLGDFSVGAKLALLGRPDRDGFKIALAADLDLPTGSADDFAGDDGWSFRPRVILGFEQQGVSAAVTGGYAARNKRAFTAANLTVDDQLLAGLALGYEVAPRQLWVLGEAYLQHVVGAEGGVRDTPVEAIAGARYALPGPFFLQGGLGFGLTSGAGAPAVRGILTLAYASDLRPLPPPRRPAPPPPPTPPPPPPKKPPADVDTDGDGLVDRLDKCPTDPEDKDGFQDDDGCPDPDNDNDGIPDTADKCPLEPEDKDGFQDDDGCPDPDNDKDGFLDGNDKCPNEAEIFNGFEDDDGCPDKGAALAVLTDGKIEIKQQVNFATNKATIKKSSFKLLATVAKIMTLHGELTKVRVEGHTDNRGKEAHNMKLSQERADSVRKHLVEVNGIEGGRLEATGYGPTRPLASNKSNKGRAANRRVEFVILERAPQGEPTPPGAAPPGAAAPTPGSAAPGTAAPAPPPPAAPAPAGNTAP